MKDTEKGRRARRHTKMRDGKESRGGAGQSERWRDKGCGTLRIGGEKGRDDDIENGGGELKKRDRWREER